MRTMDIGKLNKRLTITKLTECEDDMHQLSQKITNICTVWGSLYPVRGGEYYEVQKIKSKVTHKCYIRYRSDIDSNCFICYAGTQYSIESVIDVDGEHKMLEIMCTDKLNSEVMDVDG